MNKKNKPLNISQNTSTAYPKSSIQQDKTLTEANDYLNNEIQYYKKCQKCLTYITISLTLIIGTIITSSIITKNIFNIFANFSTIISFFLIEPFFTLISETKQSKKDIQNLKTKIENINKPQDINKTMLINLKLTQEKTNTIETTYIPNQPQQILTLTKKYPK